MAIRILPATADRRTALASPRILCVDDNQDVADSNAMLLQLAGYPAEACYCARDALRLARESPPDLCFIDLNMPGMDGDELAINLRQLAPGRPIMLVAVTAMNSEAALRRMSLAGFAVHLVKPADPEMVVNIARCVAGN